jgi:small subunit ribosomal protein S16
MAVRIRLSRYGRLHRPYFRIVAIDGRCHREGKANEILGSYDPLLKDKNISVDMEAVGRWIERGALVSVGLSKLMKHFGYVVPKSATTSAPAAATPAKKPAATGAKGVKQPWSAPTRRALRKHSAKLKGVRKAALAAAKPADAATPAAEPAKS